MMFPTLHYDVGQIKDVLRILSLLQRGYTIDEALSSFLDKEDVSLFLHITDKQSAMQELVHLTSELIWNVKSNNLASNSRKRKSSQMSGPASTGNAEDLSTFWRGFTRRISAEWSLPTETVSVDSESNLLNGFLRNTMCNSWFSTRLMMKDHNSTAQRSSLRILLQLLISSLQETTACEPASTDGKEEPCLVRGRQIRLFPTAEQRETLRKWMGMQRFVYNHALSNISSGEWEANLKFLREVFIKNKNLVGSLEWLKEYDFDLRDEALRDLIKNYKSNFARRSSQGGTFTIKYRKRKAGGNLRSLSVLKKNGI